jgi:hypothetical protein
MSVIHKPPVGGSKDVFKSAGAGQEERFGLFEVRNLPAGPWVLKLCAQRADTGAPIPISRNARVMLEHGFGGGMHGQTPVEVGMGDTIQLPAGDYYRGAMLVQTPAEWVGVTNRVYWTVAPGVFAAGDEFCPVRTDFTANVGIGGNTVVAVPQWGRRLRVLTSGNLAVSVLFRNAGAATVDRHSFAGGGSSRVIVMQVPTDAVDVQIANDGGAAQDISAEWLMHY